MLALSTERTTILIANELRSESVQRAFMDLFSPSFTFKKVGAAGPVFAMRHGQQQLIPGIVVLDRLATEQF